MNAGLAVTDQEDFPDQGARRVAAVLVNPYREDLVMEARRPVVVRADRVPQANRQARKVVSADRPLGRPEEVAEMRRRLSSVKAQKDLTFRLMAKRFGRRIHTMVPFRSSTCPPGLWFRA